jgi:hypothetical protein
LLQFETVIILALASIISAEERQCNEKDVNRQIMTEGSTLEHVDEKKQEVPSEKGDTSQGKQQETNEVEENEENINKHLGKIPEFLGYQQEKQIAEPERRDQGQQVQGEEGRKEEHPKKEKHPDVGKEQIEDEAETSKLQHDVKEISEKGNGGEQKEKKHVNGDEGTPEQAKNLNSVGEHSDQQTAQNNGLEIRQQDEDFEHQPEGYRVTEPGQDEEHQLVSQHGFNYLFRDHGGHSSQHSSSAFQGTSLDKHPDVQTITVADEGFLQQHFPVYIPDEKLVPHLAEKAVSFPARQLVSRPVTIPQTVQKHVTYSVKVPVERPYFFPFPVEKRVPFPVNVGVPVPQPYPVHVPKQEPVAFPERAEVPVPQPYPVKVPVDRPVTVPVEEHHPLVQQQVHYPAEKLPYPVKVRDSSST